MCREFFFLQSPTRSRSPTRWKRVGVVLQNATATTDIH